MNIKIYPRKLEGNVSAIPSKSQAHRLLICAAFSDRETSISCPQTNQDIEATARCLQALGAVILRNKDGYLVLPVQKLPEKATLDCGESGSTLRFMLPIAAALGVNTLFKLSGRLPQRPLSPLWEELEHHGCTLSWQTTTEISCSGQLKPGKFTMAGNVSSQFITGLLYAMAIMDGNSQLDITGTLESGPYVHMTQHTLSLFGVSTDSYCVHGGYPFTSPGSITVEGDWSNAAFFLCAQALGNLVTVSGLHTDSLQGDRAVGELLEMLRTSCQISVANIPDLLPILSVMAAVNRGAIFTDVQRLRLKESDRVASVAAMLNALGCKTDVSEDKLTVHPAKLTGGNIQSVNDHRIAMAAAIAATAASAPVTIIGAECVAKSYPSFWDEYRRLGGNYEQYIR